MMNVNRIGLRALLAVNLVLGVGSDALFAQNISETQWYFGNSPENLVFDLNGRDVNLENNQQVPFGQGGSSVIIDQLTGRLLFYSDGQNVYDGSNILLINALNGNATINVPVATAPVTANPGEFYFFTNSGNSGVNEIQYTIMDQASMAILSPNNSTGLVNPAEGMIIVPAGDGERFWLITQDRISFEYRVSLLDALGINPPVTYDFSADAPGAEAAHFSFNRDSLQLAVAPKTANRNVRILDFDPATGVLAFNQVVLNTGYDDGLGESAYDVAWSNDGSKLYISRFGSAASEANVYQYDFNDALATPNSILAAPLFRSFGLQTALDGNIYHLYQETNASPLHLGRINEPDSLFDLVAYEPLVFDVNFNGRQFPNFTSGLLFTFNTLDFTYLDSCQTNNTKFFPLVDPVPHQFSWDFGDGNGSNGFAPIHTYDGAGTYNVTLTAFINGIAQSVTKSVPILPNTAMVDLGNDTTICVDEILQLDAGPASGYLWSTGEMTQVINIDTAGTYWVEVIGPEGCTAYDEIVVTEYGVLRTVNNQWYFGESAGIDFTDGASSITDANVMFSPEGCASISDVNCELLFYTNGSTDWNKDHLVMVNGDSIGGDSTAVQSAIIMPFADETTLFYIFTNEEVIGTDTAQTKVTVVDMKHDFARGRVMVKNIPMNNFSTEKLTATSVTGSGWLLAHEFGTNVFRSHFVDGSGIGEIVFSPVGEVHDMADAVQGGGAMKFANGAQYVGAALPRTGANLLELFDFDQGTGAVTNSRLIDVQETDPLYGLEFSSDNTKVYLTTLSATGSKLIQYDLDSINAPTAEADIAASKFDGYATGANYGSLQMGPDAIIYMAVDGSTTIGTISSPGSDQAGAGFSPTGFNLLTRLSRLGLPNFAQEQSSSTLLPAITVELGCYGEPSRFTGTGRDNSIETYTWFFGDGTVVTGQDTLHAYAEPGTYNVRLLLSNRCDQDTSIYQTVTISPLPDLPQIPLDTVICDQPITLAAWPVDRAGWSYVWSTGATTRTIQVGGPTIVSVYMIDPGGCRSGTVFSFVSDGRPEVDITSAVGTDNVVVCQNDPPITLDAGNPGASYQWTINGVASGGNRTLVTNTTTPGIFEYIVAVTDPVTSCIGRDTLNLTVLALPDVTITPSPTTGCGNIDGAIDMTFNVSGNYTYELSGAAAAGPFTVDGPIAIPTIGGLDGGNYTMTVTNNVTGCVRTLPVVVEDPPTFSAVASAPNACPDEGVITITFGGAAPANINYIVTDANGVEYRNDVNLSTAPISNLDVTGLPLGTYSVFIEEVGGAACTEQEIVTISQLNAEPAFTFDAIQNICGTSGNIFIVDGSGGAATYTWSGPSIVGPNTGVSVEVDMPGTYTVLAVEAGRCDREEIIEVTINPAHGVNVDVTGDSCDGQLSLSADITGGVGPFSYQWNTGQQSAQFTALTSGNYFVTVRDQTTGCEITSAAVDIVVEEFLEVAISATPDCANNGRVQLAAIPSFMTGVTYAWTGPGGFSSIAQSVNVTAEGVYTVTATNPNGTCSAIAEFNAILTPITDADILLPETATFCSKNASDPGVALNPGAFNTYEWRRIPSPDIVSTDPIFYATQSGTYEVTLYNGFTCRTVRIDVRNNCQPQIFAPTAFTPNGDGLNDAFAVIPNDAVENFTIVISNRWGEAVYRATDQLFQWDGTRNGKMLPPGTYTYIMTFSSTEDSSAGIQQQYGAVVLIR